MGVNSVYEIPDNRNAGLDERGQRRYTKVFRVEADSMLSGPGEAISYIPVRRFDPYEESGGYVDRGALADTVDASMEAPGESLDWLVTVTYSSRFWDEVERAEQSGGVGEVGETPPNPTSGSSGGGGEPSDSASPVNPLLRPPVKRWGAVKDSRVMEFDRDPDVAGGVAMVNTVGDRFDPPYMRPETHLTLSIDKNQLEFDAPTISEFYDCTNLTDMFGFGPGTVKFEHATAVSQYENGFSYWSATYEFTIRPEGWDLEILNVGYFELVDDVKVPITINGVPVQTPQPLNSDGTRLTKTQIDNGEFVYLNRKPFPKADLSILGVE